MKPIPLPLAYAVLGLAWAVWFTPFVVRRKKPVEAQLVDKRARWGILLEAIGFLWVWPGRSGEREVVLWRLLLMLCLLAMASGLSWTGVRALGRQWRVDAGLNADHALVRSGPFALVRHPIYTSMLCVLLGTGLVTAPWWRLLCGLLFALVGTEIRVRTEDRLLGSRFGEQFQKYRREVGAYIPGLRR